MLENSFGFFSCISFSDFLVTILYPLSVSVFSKTGSKVVRCLLNVV